MEDTALLKKNSNKSIGCKSAAVIATPEFNVRYNLNIACISIFLSMFFLASGTTYGAAPAPEKARRVELINLVRNDCGSCHGLLLNGGLGPALTPQTLKDKPNDALVATILYGRTGTPMPPWHAFLTEAEAEWIIENLMQGFPNAQSN